MSNEQAKIQQPKEPNATPAKSVSQGKQRRQRSKKKIEKEKFSSIPVKFDKVAKLKPGEGIKTKLKSTLQKLKGNELKKKVQAEKSLSKVKTPMEDDPGEKSSYDEYLSIANNSMNEENNTNTEKPKLDKLITNGKASEPSNLTNFENKQYNNASQQNLNELLTDDKIPSQSDLKQVEDKFKEPSIRNMSLDEIENEIDKTLTPNKNAVNKNSENPDEIDGRTRKLINSKSLVDLRSSKVNSSRNVEKDSDFEITSFKPPEQSDRKTRSQARNRDDSSDNIDPDIQNDHQNRNRDDSQDQIEDLTDKSDKSSKPSGETTTNAANTKEVNKNFVKPILKNKPVIENQPQSASTPKIDKTKNPVSKTIASTAASKVNKDKDTAPNIKATGKGSTSDPATGDTNLNPDIKLINAQTSSSQQNNTNLQKPRDDWSSNDNRMDDNMDDQPPYNNPENFNQNATKSSNNQHEYNQNEPIYYNQDPNISQNKDGFKRFQQSDNPLLNDAIHQHSRPIEVYAQSTNLSPIDKLEYFTRIRNYSYECAENRGYFTLAFKNVQMPQPEVLKLSHKKWNMGQMVTYNLTKNHINKESDLTAHDFLYYFLKTYDVKKMFSPIDSKSKKLRI